MPGFLQGLFERKSAGGSAVSHAVSASPSARGGMYASGGPWDTDKAVKDGYERVMMVFRCIDAIASNQAPIPVYVRKGDSRTGTIMQAPRLQKLMNVRPNSYETAAMFRYRLSSQALLSRRGVFVEVVGGLQNPESLHLIPPGMCEPIPHPEKFVEGYRVRGADMSEVTLKPEQVIWIRLKPHPTDPYAQMTPLVTAGLAAETDYLARMFNRNFLMNDGRPGLLVSVRGQMSPGDAEEIKRRFSGGPAIAGMTTVIEADGMDVADLGATPRDVQWQEAVRGSGEDIRLAFGVPESILGNASGRTFDNADAEYEMFWTHTMVPHMEALADGLDVLTGRVDDDTTVAFDYRVVDVLQRQDRRKREATISEWMQGAITWNEMRQKIGEEVWADAAAADVIVLPSGFAFTKEKSKQAEILNLPNVNTIGQPQGPIGLPPRPGGGGVGNAMSQIARHGARIGAREGMRNLDNVLSARALQLAGKAEERRLAIESKAHEEDEPLDVVDAVVVTEHPYLQDRMILESKIDGLLTGWSSRQEQVVAERLDHAKVRKGTRHWEGEEKATRRLDPYYVVEVDRWAREMREDFMKVLRPTLLREASRVARDIEDNGVLDRLVQDGRITGNGTTAAERVLGSKHETNRRLDIPLNQVLDIVEKSVRNQSDRLAKKIQEMDDAGASLAEIKVEIRKMVGTRSSWRKGLGVYVTTSAIEGVRSEVYGAADGYIEKTWNTEGDERVRDSHVFVDGETKSVSEPFIVGATMMMFPGDPLAPIGETANCRCWLDYSIV